MRLKVLVDMNLSPVWVWALRDQGWEATHWLTVGDPRATDREITDWAAAQWQTLIRFDRAFAVHPTLD